jgi:hypothetical protein
MFTLTSIFGTGKGFSDKTLLYDSYDVDNSTLSLKKINVSNQSIKYSLSKENKTVEKINIPRIIAIILDFLERTFP